jgi:hypothetical protein
LPRVTGLRPVAFSTGRASTVTPDDLPPPRRRVRPRPSPTQARAFATGASSTGPQKNRDALMMILQLFNAFADADCFNNLITLITYMFVKGDVSAFVVYTSFHAATSNEATKLLQPTLKVCRNINIYSD